MDEEKLRKGERAGETGSDRSATSKQEAKQIKSGGAYCFRARDYVTFATLVLLGVILFVVTAVRAQNTRGEVAVITVDGDVFGTYSLDEPQTISITDENGEVTNTAVISDGEIYMDDADCPDKLCVKQGTIHGAGRSIICLPNRVVISVEGGGSDYDSIAE